MAHGLYWSCPCPPRWAYTASPQRLPACLCAHRETALPRALFVQVQFQSTRYDFIFSLITLSLKLPRDFPLFDGFLFRYKSTAFWLFTLNSNRLDLVLSHPSGALLTEMASLILAQLSPDANLGLRSPTSRCCLKAE